MYIDPEELKKEQKKLAKCVSVRDEFEKATLIGGCDFLQQEKEIVCAFVVYDAQEKKVVETQIIRIPESFPHLPEFRFYREGPAAITAYHKLTIRPDMLFVKGNGICHPRKLGIASHLGLVLDIPTIGIAQKLLCGEIRNNQVYFRNEKAGAVVATREFSNPLIISVGHRVSLQTAVDIVRANCIPPHKLPEPLHLAHKLLKKEGDEKQEAQR